MRETRLVRSIPSIDAFEFRLTLPSRMLPLSSGAKPDVGNQGSIKVMSIIKKIAATVVLAGTFAGIASQAFAGGSAPIWITNNVKGRAVWITIYGNGMHGNMLQAFCVLPNGQAQQSNNINIVTHTNVYVKAEFKDYGNGCGTTHNRFMLDNKMLTVNANGRSLIIYNGDDINKEPTFDSSKWH